MLPIWKDKYVTLGTNANGLQFRIKMDGDVIYTGKAFPPPGSNEVTIRVNDILADYFENNLPLLAYDHYDHTFVVEAYVSGSWTSKMNETFSRDWSYVPNFTPSSSNPPMFPVKKVVDPHAFLPVYAPGGSWSVTIYRKAGTSTTQSGTTTGDFLFFDMSSFANTLARIKANGITFYGQDQVQFPNRCPQYTLYYINSYGGWDSLLVSGRAIRTDGITRYTHDVVYDNSDARNRGRINYVNEIAASWRLNVGPLTADEASRMHHLLESPFVYLDDMSGNQVLPVILKETSVEWKDRIGSLAFYEFTAELAQERIRR